VSIAPSAPTGAGNATALNPDAGAGTKTTAFTVNAGPTITSVVPNSRGQGATNQNVVINGTNFASGVVVSFSGTGITINSTNRNSVSKITVNVTIGSGAPVGPQDVTVTNLDAGTATLASGFTINQGPAISSVVPNTQARGTTQSVTINGSGFV